MTKPSRKEGVENEPHLQQHAFHQPQPDDTPKGLDFSARNLDGSLPEDVEHSVWDEPGLSSLAGKKPAWVLDYKNWVENQIAEWSVAQSWGVVLGVLLISPLLGSLISMSYWLGSLMSTNYLPFSFPSFQKCFSLLGAPLLEEFFKILIPLWIVEKRPYFFKGWFQIFFCVLISSALFPLLFIGLSYNGLTTVPYAFPVAFSYFTMHTITGTLSACGLEKIWRRAIFAKQQPQLNDGAYWFMVACGIHFLWSIGICGLILYSMSL